MVISFGSVRDAFNFITKVGNVEKARDFFVFMDLNSQDYFVGAVKYVEQIKRQQDLKFTLVDISKGDYDNYEVLVIPFGGDLEASYIERFSSMGGQQEPIKWGSESFNQSFKRLGSERVFQIMDTISQQNVDVEKVASL